MYLNYSLDTPEKTVYLLSIFWGKSSEIQNSLADIYKSKVLCGFFVFVSKLLSIDGQSLRKNKKKKVLIMIGP